MKIVVLPYPFNSWLWQSFLYSLFFGVGNSKCCDFNQHFPGDCQFWSLFHLLSAIYISSFMMCLFCILLIFKWVVFSLLSCSVYKHFVKICVVNIFSQCLVYLLIFLVVCFDEQNFILIKSNLCIFYILCFLCFLQEILAYPKVVKILYCIFSRSFIVLTFMFRSVIHLKFILGYGMRYELKFSFFPFYRDIQLL